jgi:hypothetical protein
MCSPPFGCGASGWVWGLLGGDGLLGGHGAVHVLTSKFGISENASPMLRLVITGLFFASPAISGCVVASRWLCGGRMVSSVRRAAGGGLAGGCQIFPVPEARRGRIMPASPSRPEQRQAERRAAVLVYGGGRDTGSGRL